MKEGGGQGMENPSSVNDELCDLGHITECQRRKEIRPVVHQIQNQKIHIVDEKGATY